MNGPRGSPVASAFGARTVRGRGLATAQVAVAIVLLVGAGLLLRSFVAIVTVDRGYAPTNVITARTANPEARRGADALWPGAGAARPTRVSGPRSSRP